MVNLKGDATLCMYPVGRPGRRHRRFGRCMAGAMKNILRMIRYDGRVYIISCTSVFGEGLNAHSRPAKNRSEASRMIEVLHK